MTALTPNRLNPSVPIPPVRDSFIRRLKFTIPTFLVLTGLAGVAYWGHVTGWKITPRQSEDALSNQERSEGQPPVVHLLSTGSTTESSPLPGQNVRIDFSSAMATDAFGIDINSVWPTNLIEQVAAGGEVMFDPSRVAKLSARAGGVTRMVFKAAGDRVQVGDVVALIDSPDVGRAKSEFQQALVQGRLRARRRDDLVSAKSAGSEAVIREAESAFKEAEVRLLAASQALSNLGLSITPADYRNLSPADATRRIRFLGVEEAVSRLDGPYATANLLPIRAPFNGIVLTADAVAGEVVETGKPLFVIVDPTQVWVTLHVSPEDTRRISTGQRVFYRPDGTTRELPGTVLSVGTVIEETTRTMPIRAEMENAAGSLRASTLGRGRIVLREVPNVLVVPHDAVQVFRSLNVVFVRDPDFMKPDGPKAFHARVVTIGGRDERNTEILAGLSQGEIVVAKGSRLLLGELTRAAVKR